MSPVKKTIASALILMLVAGLPLTRLQAQGKLSIDKVYSAYLRNSGPIVKNNQVKGYYLFYQSDKIDKHTNEYTLQILDENLNKVKNIKFDDSKDISLLESAYNGATIAFLFKNEEGKTLDLKVYDLEGKLKYSYSREFDKRTDDLMKMYASVHLEEGLNRCLFDVGERGFISMLPMRDGKLRTYEIDYYSTQAKKQWNYVPMDDEDKFAFAEYLGCTDSLIVLEVMKKSRLLSNKMTTHVVGINFVTRKKQFDLDYSSDTLKMVPSSISRLEGTNNILLMGTYYNKDENVGKDYGKGLAVYEITTMGKIVTRTCNSWTEDVGKYLPVNNKGKIDGVGYLYIQKVLRMPDHRLYIVGEGYKRQADAAGIALTALAAVGGAYGVAGATKIEITDLVMMELDASYKVQGATIYEKTHNRGMGGPVSDQNSQHALALALKATRSFDYEFTTGEEDNSNFAVCYSDWVRGEEYKGETFNSIRYNGKKFTTDKIELKSKASTLRVLPAKAGSIMILEYFKKDKRLEMRLEKLG